MLARLFTRPANLLILDEPTNDLDIDTLEILENLLVAYAGTLLLISHDRQFIDNVVTSTLVFEGNGKIGEYVGGFDDWRRQSVGSNPDSSRIPTRKARKPAAKKKNSRKMGYLESRELERLPRQIEQIEEHQKVLYTQLCDPSFYKTGGENVTRIQSRLADLDKKLEAAYRRWEELETRQDQINAGL
jgi:ATP-binding cassette subfamily F protein uup